MSLNNACSLLDLDVSKHANVLGVQVLVASHLVVSEGIGESLVVNTPQTSDSREENEGVLSHHEGSVVELEGLSCER
jgi:hypothetical protein